MSLFDLSLFLFFIGGVTIVSYKNIASSSGWPVGALYYNEFNLLKTIAILSQFGSFVIAFFFAKWYFVLIGAGLGWLISCGITYLFKTKTQIVGPIIILCATLLWLLVKTQIF